MKRIEDELHRSDNKRVEVKRALIKFTKENMSGYKLEQPNLLKMDQYQKAHILHLNAVPPPRPFSEVIDKKPNTKSLIYQEHKELLADLQERYCPLYELKFNSCIEDVHYSLADVALASKQAYQA